MQLCEAARESAKILSDCAEHMMSLVDDILDFARIETKYSRLKRTSLNVNDPLTQLFVHCYSQLELECIPFDVKEEVDKAFNIHVILANAKDVKLEVKTIELAHPFHIGSISIHIPMTELATDIYYEHFLRRSASVSASSHQFAEQCCEVHSPGGYVSVEVINLPSSPGLISGTYRIVFMPSSTLFVSSLSLSNSMRI